jgi:hypothetical protein
LRRALALRPSYAEAWGWLAQAVAVRSPREALAAMDTALRLDPASAGMQMARAVVGFMIDSAALQHAAAEPLVKLRPDLLPAIILDAMALTELGRPVECLALPNLPTSLRAMCQHAAGQQQSAADLFRRQLAELRSGQLDNSILWLPIALANAGRLEDALDASRSVLALTPFHMVVVENHGLVRSPADPDGTRFSTAVRALRESAWVTRVRASRASMSR